MTPVIRVSTKKELKLLIDGLYAMGYSFEPEDLAWSTPSAAYMSLMDQGQPNPNTLWWIGRYKDICISTSTHRITPVATNSVRHYLWTLRRKAVRDVVW